MNYWECANCGRHSIDVDAHNGRPVCTSCKSYNVANLNLAPPGRLAPAALPQIEDTKDDQARVDRECEVVGQDLPRTDNQLASTLGLRRAQPRPFIPDPEDQELYDKLAAAEAEVLRLTTRVQELEAALEAANDVELRGVREAMRLARLRVVRETPEGQNHGSK